jgi:hypothetical protein
MLKMNAGTWIGLIAGGIGIAVAVTSVLATSSFTGSYITIGILLLIAGFCFLFYKLFFAPMLNASRLHKVGLPGKARILEVRDTGVTINNNPQVKLVLEVKTSFGQTYTTTCRVLVSRINPRAYSPGMELPVKIDPKNEKNVIIDMEAGRSAAMPSANSFAGNFSQPAVNTEALKAELEKMQQDNDAIRLSGHPARAIVKKYTWLGIYVNGNNPYVELEVEVLPDSSPSFPAGTKGVIAEASVPKFQPGQEIFVKYDFYDNSKVVIDHS